MGRPSLRTNRDFSLLWIGQTLSTLGGRASSIAFPLLVLATTGSPSKTGLVALVANAPFVLLQLPAGAYVDRWNRRAVMLWADAGRALVIGSLAVALVLDRLTFAHILVVAAVEGSLFVAFRLAEAAALKQVVPDPAQLSDAIALNQARVYGTSLAGEPLGGFLFGLRPVLPFVADALSYVASLATILAIRTPLPAPARTAPRHIGREILEGLAVAWSNRFLRTTTLLTMGSDFVINGLFLIVIVIATAGGASPTEVGIMLAIGSAGGVFGSLTAPLLRRRIRSLRIVIAGVVWAGVPAIALVASTADPFLLGALLGVTLSLWPLYNAVVVSRWMTQIPDRLMGRVQSAVALFGWAPVPLAPFIGGVMIERVGATWTVLAFTGIMLIVAIAASVNRTIAAESIDAARTERVAAEHIEGADTPTAESTAAPTQRSDSDPTSMRESGNDPR
jgi:MFS family permease